MAAAAIVGVVEGVLMVMLLAGDVMLMAIMKKLWQRIRNFSLAEGQGGGHSGVGVEGNASE